MNDLNDDFQNNTEYPPMTQLGPCCICECAHGVINVVLLDKQAPRPGAGCWGCMECGLPLAGAVAVLCMSCFVEFQNGAPIKFACVGTPQNGERVPVASLTENFTHNRARHFIAAKFSPN